MTYSISAKCVHIVLLSFLVLSLPPSTCAGESTEDALQILIPLTAYGTTFYFDDEEGRPQFYKAFATNTVVTYGLKAAVDKERPDHSDDDSFPSGHTSAAFMGAAFLHKRYGWKYAMPAYLGAVYVAHRRVEMDKHYTEDVIAGAVIGVLSSYYFTRPYKGVNVQPYAKGDSYGVVLSKNW